MAAGDGAGSQAAGDQPPRRRNAKRRAREPRAPRAAAPRAKTQARGKPAPKAKARAKAKTTAGAGGAPDVGSKRKGFEVIIDYEGSNGVRDHNLIGYALAEHCTKFVFQLELGERSGKLHWQCRIRLRKKMTVGAFKKNICDVALWGARTIPTCNEVFRAKGAAAFNYVTKSHTRQAGPWYDHQFDVAKRSQMTRQLEDFMGRTLLPYQQFICEGLQEWDARRIVFIRDKPGHCGKTVFTEWLEYYKIAEYIPPLDTLREVMQAVYATPVERSSAFVIDVPRSVRLSNGTFWAGMESLKDGKSYDGRYSWKKRWQTRPGLVVMGNRFPQFEEISADKWELYDLTKEGEPAGITMERLSVEEAAERTRLEKEQENAGVPFEQIEKPRFLPPVLPRLPLCKVSEWKHKAPSAPERPDYAEEHAAPPPPPGAQPSHAGSETAWAAETRLIQELFETCPSEEEGVEQARPFEGYTSAQARAIYSQFAGSSDGEPSPKAPAATIEGASSWRDSIYEDAAEHVGYVGLLERGLDPGIVDEFHAWLKENPDVAKEAAARAVAEDIGLAQLLKNALPGDLFAEMVALHDGSSDRDPMAHFTDVMEALDRLIGTPDTPRRRPAPEPVPVQRERQLYDICTQDTPGPSVQRERQVLDICTQVTDAPGKGASGAAAGWLRKLTKKLSSPLDLDPMPPASQSTAAPSWPESAGHTSPACPPGEEGPGWLRRGESSVFGESSAS